jgi:cell division transport system permease protein
MRVLIRLSRHCLREAWDGVWRYPALSFLSVLSIGVSLYVLGLFLLLVFNLNVLVDSLGHDMQVQMFFAESATPDEIDALRSTLESDPAVATVFLVSSEEARRRFQENFPTLGDLPDTLGGQVFPVSLELILHEGHRTPDAVVRLARAYERAAGVEEVRYDLGWIQRMSALVTLVRRGGYGIAALLLGAVMVTVGAVVRLTILARREEIDIMKLVGATSAFIRGPFLIGAAAQGLAAGGLALGGLLLTHRLIERSDIFADNPFLYLVAGRFLPPPGAAFLAVSGAVVGIIAAAMALRRAGSY